MKFLILLVVVVTMASAQFPSFGRSRLQARPQPFAQLRPAASSNVVKRVAPPRASNSDQNANVVRFDNDINPDGSYRFSYETDNGITAEEQGNGYSAQGSFAYTAADGTPISLSYVADENGFQPQGAHLPIAPPVPEAILRSLEWNRAHPDQSRK